VPAHVQEQLVFITNDEQVSDGGWQVILVFSSFCIHIGMSLILVIQLFILLLACPLAHLSSIHLTSNTHHSAQHSNSLSNNVDIPYSCNNLTTLGAAWGPLSTPFILLPATFPSPASKLSHAINWDSLDFQWTISDAYEAGCREGMSGFTFGMLYCTSSKYEEYTLLTGSWSNNATSNGTNQMILTFLAPIPAETTIYVWFIQDTTRVTCSPYPVSVLLTGNLTVVCLNNGSLDLSTGLCLCASGYYGNTCALYGKCDPSSPLASCKTSQGKNGMQNCRVSGNYTTSWGECVANSESFTVSDSAIGIGIGVAVGVAGIVIGVAAGYYISKRRSYSLI